MQIGQVGQVDVGIQPRELKGIVGEFYWDEVIDPEATEKTGIPQAKRVAMFKWRQIGDNKSETHAPASEGIIYDRTAGVRLSAAEVWSDEYKRFVENADEQGAGTPLEVTGISGAWVKNLAGHGIKFAEQLLNAPDGSIAKLGMGARQVRDQVARYMEKATASVDVVKMQRELEELKAQLALKTAGSTPVRKDDQARAALADLDEDALKIYIKENGGTVPRGKASKETLLDAAVDVAAKMKAAA